MITPDMAARQLRRILDQPLRLKLMIETANGAIVEPSGGGYADHVFVLADWTIDGGRATGTVREYRFDGTRRFVVTGSFLVDASGGIYWIDRFDIPTPIGRTGDILPVQPIMQLQDSGAPLAIQG